MRRTYSDQGIQEIPTTSTCVDLDLTTRSSDSRVLVERFPQLVDGGPTGLRSNIEKDADVGFENRSESVEEPPMRVELLLVLLLENEDDLNRNRSNRNVTSLENKRKRVSVSERIKTRREVGSHLGNHGLRGDLEDVSSDLLVSD